MSYGKHIVHIDELPGLHRLGRHVHWDSRSLQYQVDEEAAGTIATHLWGRNIPILDQGDLGSCTGNASVGALGSDPFYGTLSHDEQASLNENGAVTIYGDGTDLDSDPENYPPNDTGCDGLSVAKACKNLGFISGYVHATSLSQMQAALMNGPIIMGANWYEGFDNPDANGYVTIDGAVRGGHEFVVRGIDVDHQTFQADNSWGVGWGNKGSFSFSYDSAERLLGEQGDAVLFVPITQPAPTPTPVPVPTPTPGPSIDAELAEVLTHVLHNTFHYFGKHSAQVAREWLTALGYDD